MNIKPKALATLIIIVALTLLAGCSPAAGSQFLPTLMPVAEMPPAISDTSTVIAPTNTPAPTLTPPQYRVSDGEFRDIVERVSSEWNRIMEEDQRLTSSFSADFDYYLEAEYCNGDIDCELDAIDSIFEAEEAYRESLSLLHSDLLKANQELRDISRSDVSPGAEPALISMRNAADSFEKYYSYTFMAFAQEMGSSAEERLFDQSLEAFEEGTRYYALAWEILGGQAEPEEIERILNQPESLEFVGFGNQIEEFSLGGASGIKVKGTHRGDSNFIGEIFDVNGVLEAVVINCIGWCSDASITRLGPGTHYLEITADGDWEAVVELTR